MYILNNEAETNFVSSESRNSRLIYKVNITFNAISVKCYYCELNCISK